MLHSLKFWLSKDTKTTHENKFNGRNKTVYIQLLSRNTGKESDTK